MSRYKLNPKLAERVKEELDRDPDEQLAIYEELALIRVHANDYVKMYSDAVEQEHYAQESGDLERIHIAKDRRVRAGALMAESIQNVTEVCAKAVKIQNAQKDRFSIHDIKFILLHIQRICATVVGAESPYLAEKFMRVVEEDLSIPRISAIDRGTQLNIDETAIHFDQSVPLVTEPDPVFADISHDAYHTTNEADGDGEEMAQRV